MNWGQNYYSMPRWLRQSFQHGILSLGWHRSLSGFPFATYPNELDEIIILRNCPLLYTVHTIIISATTKYSYLFIRCYEFSSPECCTLQYSMEKSIRRTNNCIFSSFYTAWNKTEQLKKKPGSSATAGLSFRHCI